MLPPIRVTIAHGDPIVGAGIAALLSSSGEVEMCGAGAGIVITDSQRGLERLQHCPLDGPAVLIVAASCSAWELRQATDAGVHGYLLQSSSPEQLLAAVRVLGHGGHYLSPDLRALAAERQVPVSLTGRESDVLRLLAQGRCNKAIARELGIGVGTVKTHVKNLFGKLGATARTHAVVLAARQGLIAG